MTDKCPICLEGNLVQKNYTGTLSHKGITAHISSFEHSVCDCCESELANHLQTKNNKLIAIEFQRVADGFLPPSQILSIRKKLKLNTRDASSIIGGGGIAFSKYENGTIKQSTAVDNLLRLLDEKPDLLADLRSYQTQRTVCEAVQATFFLSPTGNMTEKEHEPPKGVFTKLLEGSGITTFKPAPTTSHEKPRLSNFFSFGIAP